MRSRSLRRVGLRRQRYLSRFVLASRIRWYRALSNNQGAFEGSTIMAPIHATGPGLIVAHGACLGYVPSPFAFDRCISIEARTADSSVIFRPGVMLNNGAVLISIGPGIEIGENSLIGPDVHIFDSDFHHLDPERRKSGIPAMGRVEIGRNVFVGDRVTILRGVAIGDDSVIAAGSVVTTDVPPGVVAGGSPCRVIRGLADLPGDDLSQL